jgi:hypothetical protein
MNRTCNPARLQRKENPKTTLRRLLLTSLASGALLLGGAGIATAEEQDLPTSAPCNAGTMNAHGSITPETNPAHERVPEAEGGPCMHEVGPGS